MHFMNCVLRPVSYTHLDVYKRQAEFLSEVFLLTARILDKNRFVLPLFVSAAQKSAMIKEEQPAETCLLYTSKFFMRPELSC